MIKLCNLTEYLLIHINECRRYKTSEIIVMDRVQAYMDGPRLLRMRLSELVPLVRVELRS